MAEFGRAVMRKQALRPTESFLNRLNVHTLNGYDVRAQVIALVREHLKPGEFFKKRMKSAMAHFGGWRESVNPICSTGLRALIHWDEMLHGCRLNSSMTRKRRSGLSNVSASWRLGNARLLRC
jgi:hypothetical protein